MYHATFYITNINEIKPTQTNYTTNTPHSTIQHKDIRIKATTTQITNITDMNHAEPFTTRLSDATRKQNQAKQH